MHTFVLGFIITGVVVLIWAILRTILLVLQADRVVSH